jgi:hypothetical protein
MMAGGIYPGTEKSAYVSGRHGRKIVYGEPFPIDEPREIEPMQPVLMGTLTHTPLLPAHMTLRLPSDKPLWVQKLGDLPVGIASIETVATHYGSTHASEVYQVVFGTPDELILGYKQDEQPPQPHNIYIGG